MEWEEEEGEERGRRGGRGGRGEGGRWSGRGSTGEQREVVRSATGGDTWRWVGKPHQPTVPSARSMSLVRMRAGCEWPAALRPRMTTATSSPPFLTLWPFLSYMTMVN